MSEWISVDVCMPKHNGSIGCNLGDSIIVDVFTDGERWPECYYSFDEETWVCSDIKCLVSNVTHWMTIPEPPKQ